MYIFVWEPVIWFSKSEDIRRSEKLENHHYRYSTYTHTYYTIYQHDRHSPVVHTPIIIICTMFIEETRSVDILYRRVVKRPTEL